MISNLGKIEETSQVGKLGARDGKRFAQSHTAGWDRWPWGPAPDSQSDLLPALGGGPEVRPARAAPLLHVLLGIVPGVPTALIKEDLRGWVFLATLCETAHLSLDILKDKSRLFLGNRPDARPFIIWWHGSQRITDKGK